MSQPQALHVAALLNGGGHGIPVVGVKAEGYVDRQEFATGVEHLQVFARVGIQPVVVPVHTYLEGLVPQVPARFDLVQHLAGRALPSKARAPVDRDTLSRRTSKHPVERQPDGLGCDIPERRVHRTHSRALEPARAQGLRLGPHTIPYLLGITRVQADDAWPDDVLDKGLQGLPEPSAALPKTFDTLICLNAYDHRSDF